MPASSTPSIPIPAGTALTVRLIDGIDVDSTAAGQKFRASLDDPIMMGGDVVVPRGANVVVQAANVVQSGRMKGSDEISLKVNSITVHDKSYAVVYQLCSREDRRRRKEIATQDLGRRRPRSRDRCYCRWGDRNGYR